MIGQMLGSFRILSELGTGGMGVIYTAEHQIIGKRAAIKVLRPEMSRDREIVGRFFNEAKAVTAIDHPGLVDVYDFGYTENGSAYIVMELLSGESLGARLRREHALPIDLTIALVRQMCGALGAAHERFIVHRDLKPDNIFLVRDPDVAFGVRAKVLDFGIAKLAPELGGLGPETRTGVLLGTPMYMAPEQCRGAGEVDHRADIYALGVIVFEMVCGQPPFTGVGLGEVIAKHQYVAPPAPRSLRPELPAALDALISRMLEKEPARRPQAVAEVMHALDGRVATTSGVAIAPHSDVHAVVPVTLPRRRPPWRLIGGVLATVAAVTATGMVLHAGARAKTTFDHLDLVPTTTKFVAAIDVAKLEDTEVWREVGPSLLAAFDQSVRARPLTQLRLSCDFDLARDLSWAMFVLDGPALRPEQGALIVNGAWSRAKLEHCFAQLSPDSLHSSPSPGTLVNDIQHYGELWIRWIAPDTAALSFSRESLPLIAQIKPHASRPGDRAGLDAAVGDVDRGAAIWIAGASRGFPAGLDPGDTGALDHASRVAGSVTFSGDHGDLHFAAIEPAGEAVELARNFDASIERVHLTMPIVSLFHGSTNGDAFVIDAHLAAKPLAAVIRNHEHQPTP